ncbi:alpha/beta hydrolase [Plantactinospora sp. S1510]|uniref:Alpha/beta hydrolase n=1 Tax=Plantactinospora alkalitolerans TaxID=2789879 RepID=A0ABS0GPH9_9ACTN|nr:alpha/beta hydrolase [Plantactinospora alkalitolerans]MBF9128070.1 alpha/beta hydrolase [Plantactinospora alkalitolerans]
MAEATVVGRAAWMRLRGPAGPLRARVHWPVRRSGGPAPALLVFFHASGFVPGSVDSAEALCRELCSRTGVVVLSASYRTAPPHPYPAGFHDAANTLEWAADHATEIDADPARLLVAGEGAGGNLAAAVALHARDRGWPSLTRQVLVSPNLDARQNTRSYADHAHAAPNSAARMRWYYDHYLPGGPASADPYASPLSAPSVAAVAPATIVTVERDPLRDDGRRYAARLRRAGVPVRELRYVDLAHGALARLGDSAADRMLADLVRTLREGAGPDPA